MSNTKQTESVASESVLNVGQSQEGVKSDLHAISDLIGAYNPEAITAMYAQSQTGKTTLMVQLMMEFSHKTGLQTLGYDTEGGFRQFVDSWYPILLKRYPKAQKPIIRTIRNWKDILLDHGRTVKTAISENGKWSVNPTGLTIRKVKKKKGEEEKTIEEEFCALEDFCKEHKVGLIVYDSLTAPVEEFGTSTENFGARATVMKLWFRSMIDIQEHCKLYILATHHAMINPTDKYSKEAMSGGQTPQYWSKVIISMKKVDANGARDFRIIKLQRFFKFYEGDANHIPDRLVRLTSDRGYVDATREDKEKAIALYEKENRR